MPDAIRLANDAADLAARDAYLEANAEAFDAICPGFSFGDILRTTWQDIRPLLIPCGCVLGPFLPTHIWDCDLTPIYAQTVISLDLDPTTLWLPTITLSAPRKAIT